jgi:Flp pilus assembly protein TadB
MSPPVGPPETGRNARPCLLRFLEIEETDMAHWPRSVYGNVLLFMVAIGLAAIAVSIATVVPVALLAAAAAVVAVACVVLYVWRRRVEAARERAWVGAFSFGDVVERMRAREALRRSSDALAAR